MAISLHHRTTRRYPCESSAKTNRQYSHHTKVCTLDAPSSPLSRTTFRRLSDIRASGLSTFRTMHARLSHFHCVPVDRPTLSQVTTFTGTNLRRRLGSMLRQPLTTDEIHSPPVIFAQSRSFGHRYDRLIARHSRRMTFFRQLYRDLGTAGCSQPTGLEPLPTSLSPSRHHRDHCQVYGCDPYFDRSIVLSEKPHRGETFRSRVSRPDQPFCSPDQDEPDLHICPYSRCLHERYSMTNDQGYLSPSEDR